MRALRLRASQQRACPCSALRRSEPLRHPRHRHRHRHRVVVTNASSAAAAAASTSAAAAVKLLSAVSLGGAAGNTLPVGTSKCLSAAAFNVILPSFLLCSVGETIASFKATGSLPASTAIFVPCFALFQIGAGMLLGAIVNASAIVTARTRGMREWHPVRPAAAAEEIAAVTARAAGIGAEKGKEALLGPAARRVIGSSKDAARGGMKGKIFSLACAFGNTFTLPALILSSLLGATPQLERRAIGYLALYLVTWSPMLWGVGKLIVTSDGDAAPRPPRRIKTTEEAAKRFVDTTTAPALPASASEAASTTGDDQSRLVTAPSLSSPSSRARTRSITARVRSALATLDEVMTPPLYGVLAGILMGLSPLAKYYFPIGSALGAGADLPLEVRGLVLAAKICLDVAKLFGGGALATSTLVLALALFPSQAERQRQEQEQGAASSSSEGGTGNPLDVLAQVFQDPDESMELAKVCVVRLILLPLLTLATTMLLRPHGFFQDRVLLLCMLILSSMPSAQNMIIILNLSAAANAFSSRFARMMMAQYIVSLATTFVWLIVFQRVVGPVASLA